MTEPELDRSLIEAAREGLGPTIADRHRLRRAVTAGIAAGGATAATSAAAQGSGLAAWSGWKLALVATTIATGVVGGATWLARPADAPPASTSTPHAEHAARAPANRERGEQPTAAPVPVRPEALPAPIAPAPVDAPPQASPRVHAARRSEPSATVTPAAALLAETALMREVHGALRAGDPQRALELLDRHAAEYPDGELREERLAARVTALCEVGRREEAQAERARFLAAYPRSMQAARVRASCTDD